MGEGESATTFNPEELEYSIERVVEVKVFLKCNLFLFEEEEEELLPCFFSSLALDFEEDWLNRFSSSFQP